MWCYRVERHMPHDGFTISLADYQRAAVKTTRGFAVDSDASFAAAMTLTFDLFKHIGWDGTREGEVRCFSIPGLYSMMVGFIITDLQGRNFIASPIPLPHIEKDMDWDARVSHEEILATRKVILQGHLPEKTLPVPKVGMGGWRVSSRGNMWCTINGCSTTIYAWGDGYKAVINPAGRQPIHTKMFQTRDEVQRYVLKHWYEILDPREAIGGPVSDDDDPDFW